jgi:hypothetical protein
MPVIWNLKVNFRRKIGIICIFLLGVVVCVTSIIRIVELTKFVVTNPTYTQVHASTWTTIEQGVAVVSGNLPLLTLLFERFFRKQRYRLWFVGIREGKLTSRIRGGGSMMIALQVGPTPSWSSMWNQVLQRSRLSGHITITIA